MEIENIDAFFGMIEAGEEKKETVPIFIKELKGLDKMTGKLHAEIIIQTQYDTNMILQHRITEGIDAVQNYPMDLLAMMAPEKKGEMEKKWQDDVKHQDEQIEAEKGKLIKVLQSKGFKIFIPGVWQE